MLRFLLTTALLAALIPACAIAADARDADCPLDVPRPLFSAQGVGIKHYAVRKINGGRELAETVVLNSGEAFLVEQGGCEYLAQTIWVQSDALRGAKTAKDDAALYTGAASALEKLTAAALPRVKALPFTHAATKLREAARVNTAPGEELMLPAPESVNSAVTLLPEKKRGGYTVRLEIYWGPL